MSACASRRRTIENSKVKMDLADQHNDQSLPAPGTGQCRAAGPAVVPLPVCHRCRRKSGSKSPAVQSDGRCRRRQPEPERRRLPGEDHGPTMTTIDRMGIKMAHYDQQMGS